MEDLEGLVKEITDCCQTLPMKCAFVNEEADNCISVIARLVKTLLSKENYEAESQKLVQLIQQIPEVKTIDLRTREICRQILAKIDDMNSSCEFVESMKRLTAKYRSMIYVLSFVV